MYPILLVLVIISWLLLLIIGFLLWGTLRSLGLVTWRLDQLEATTPRRIGRDGIKLGQKAPGFALVSTAGDERTLADFAGSRLLLVFTQSGCGPCADIVPDLNRLHDRSELQVLVVNNGSLEATRTWAIETRARFSVLAQEHFSLSKRYEVFVTPFAFLIDEQGIVISKGIVGSRQYLQYVLSGAGAHINSDHSEPQPHTATGGEIVESPSEKELDHV
jgi:peroxiredoxin